MGIVSDRATNTDGSESIVHRVHGTKLTPHRIPGTAARKWLEPSRIKAKRKGGAQSVPDITPPTLLTASHYLGGFDCGELTLDEWLKHRALKNQGSDASRTYVVCEGDDVVGYYCLCAAAITRDSAPRAWQRNMPDPLPAILLGRLAINRRHQNQGIGKALLFDALMRVMHVAESAGVFAILVHAISEPAKRFYLSQGFVESPSHPMMMLMTLATVRSIMAEPG